MQFPTKITCHDGKSDVFNYGPSQWRPAETGPNQSHPTNDGPFRPFRTCSYCGSMHPEDLLKALQNGATLDRADWKYGWPHKFYVGNISHDYEAVPVIVGSLHFTDPKGNRVIKKDPAKPMGKGWGKWYNLHLSDAGFGDEAFDALANIILIQTGITFVRDAYGVKFRGKP